MTLQRFRHVVGVADRDAARGDDRVGLSRCGLERLQRRLARVRDDAEVEDLHAQPREHAVQRIAVAVEDLAGPQVLTDRAQLVARGEDCDTRLAPHRHEADAERGEQSQLRGVQHGARPEREFAATDVLAGRTHVLADAVARLDSGPARLEPDVLLHHDRVGSRRDAGAGHDAHALPRPHLALERPPRPRGADDLEPRGAGRGQLATGQGVTVHRRVTVRGDVDRRAHFARQDTSECAAQCDMFHVLHRHDRGDHAGPRLVERQRRAPMARRVAGVDARRQGFVCSSVRHGPTACPGRIAHATQ